MDEEDPQECITCKNVCDDLNNLVLECCYCAGTSDVCWECNI